MSDAITFRRETPADLAFVYALYASTRADEMRIVPWDDAQKNAFVQQQFFAQKSHYEKHYPECQFLIVERSGEPIGRIYIDRAREEIHVLDITLAPAARGAGIGGRLMQDLIDEGAASGRSVSIHVENFNPAQRLYERLGFERVSEYGVYYLMIRRPPAAAADVR